MTGHSPETTGRDAADLKRQVTRMFERDRGRIAVFQLVPRRSCGAEVGVWRGDFTNLLLQIVTPASLHLIDPWQFRSDKPMTIYGGRTASVTSQADMDQMHAQVVDRFAGAAVRVHRQPSVAAASTFPDAYFDWVYIDGDHFYDGVLADLRAFAPKVKPGGLLIGDDYNWNRDPAVRWPVQAAVDVFRREHALERVEVARWNAARGELERQEVHEGAPCPEPSVDDAGGPPQFILTLR